MVTHSSADTHLLSRFTGLILGQAVGDALGLPREGLSRRRAAKMFGEPGRYRFLFGRGMVSDDTEHLCMTAQAVLAYPDDPELFARSLAWRLKWWLAGLPAGTGFATLRAICKLWVGVPPRKSGVYSAGNGPAMRAAVLGALFRDDRQALRQYVRASTRLTHTDPKAEEGALVVALSAAWAVQMRRDADDPFDLMDALCKEVKDPELAGLLEKISDALDADQSVEGFADSLGLEKGVSGYIYHTVPVVIFAFLRQRGDFDSTVKDVIALGGDADSTGAIAGALAGAAAGYEAISPEYMGGIVEWPRSVSWMKRLAHRSAILHTSSSPEGPVNLFWPGMVPRNLVFLLTVLVHGLRRLLPPY